MSLNHYGVEGSGAPVVTIVFWNSIASKFVSLKGESVVFKQAPKEEKGGGTGEGD